MLDMVNKLDSQLKTCSAHELTLGGLFEATKVAADAGDPYARACFIRGRFADWPERTMPPLPQEDVNIYLESVQKYIEEGLKGGDWNIVAVLAQHRFNPGDLILRTHYGAGTTETEYKMKKLLRLGADNEFATTLDDELGNPPLPADVVTAANQWAEDTYNSYFAGSTRLNAMPLGCSARSEDSP